MDLYLFLGINKLIGFSHASIFSTKRKASHNVQYLCWIGAIKPNRSIRPNKSIYCRLCGESSGSVQCRQKLVLDLILLWVFIEYYSSRNNFVLSRKTNFPKSERKSNLSNKSIVNVQFTRSKC